jgi:tetratricopeptide (TPR) repeat protein
MPIPPADVSEALAAARQAIEEGDRYVALAAYERVVESGEMLENVAGDLATLGQKGILTARANRILGDALFGLGRLQDALDAYRSALDQL